MSSNRCPREQDVLDLVAIGQWPRRAAADLLAHAEGCEACRGLGDIASAMVEMRDSESVRVPEAALVWHRAQMRARLESARLATRPLLAVQTIVVGVALSVSVALWGGIVADWFGRWPSVMERLRFPPTQAPDWIPIWSAGRWLLFLVLGWAVVVSVALSLAGLADRESPRTKS